MDIRTTIASEINQHHAIATAKAGEAIQHAKEAGRLLLEVKAALPHGEFGKWLEQNITVSVRQAQRYIAVAEGKQVPMRELASKSDTVSHLTESAESQIPEDLREWLSEPVFSPTVGYWYCTTTEDAAWWVVPSLEHPDHFHISKFHQDATAKPDPDQPDWDGQSLFDGTKRPVPAWLVETTLQRFGMNEPISQEWSSKKKEGLSRPFGEPEATPLSGKQASITKDRATHAKSIAAVPEAEFEEEMRATFPHRGALPSSNAGA
jgi:hypothetical protein